MAIQQLSTIDGLATAERGEALRSETVSFRDLINFLRRNAWLITLSTAIGLLLGVTYIIKTPSSYQAYARLVIDPEQSRILSQDAATGTVIIEAAEIASQVEIVKSEAIAESVIRELGLLNDPEIVDASSWYGALRHYLASAVDLVLNKQVVAETPQADEERMRRTMNGFLSRVSVRRVGQSYVLEIGYRSGDPDKAARTANALAEAYIRNGMDDRAAAAKQGALWLEGRLMDVGRKAREAALAAEEYRNQHDITAMANATTLDQQQLAELSSQMLAARAATSDASAKLTTLTRLIENNSTDSNLPELADNPQLMKLREEMRLAETRLAGLKERYTPGNPAITAATADIARIQSSLVKELRQVEALYRSNLETAKSREALAEQQFASANRQGADKNIARVELAEIESRASTYRQLYESILQQFVGAFQTQSFPLGKARVVTAATAPLTRVWPKPSVLLPFSMILGVSFGLLAAVSRHVLDRRTGSGERLQRELGLAPLGHVPIYRQAGARRDNAKNLPPTVLPLRAILDTPYSAFSEALRGVKHSLDSLMPADASVVIGITSVGSGEGKTTIATNLAQLYQNEEQSVLLVDADFVSARLSKLAYNAAPDFAIEPISSTLLGGPSDGNPVSRLPRMRRYPEKVVIDHDPEYGADEDAVPVPLLTVEQTRRSAIATYRYGHLSALKEALTKLRTQYKMIIVDMSGFEESADTRAICSHVDGIILVIGNSRKLTIERLSEALKSFGRSRIALLGVVSNRSRIGSGRHRTSTRGLIS
ncbi:succinoglycan biosynthesis transport protein ExoP [Pseudorhizobium tarimense]|uniref:Succinoglycan biosynthesis transport protein ExoP n=1 Tax=Pseudorhizobium tarimense TaxID=1079109 RepID=A0ABV2H4B7_9HYPH|nr:exopolysaccharide transport family protein [Pseudorhizobium tarimense]MCJ8518612.1 exopolysaccharide transport family protein [Pseudorhizobium tarimense]